MKHRIFAVLFSAVAFLAAPVAHAQLIVDLQFEKNVFIAYEPVPVTVTVLNRAGQDVVLAGPNKTNWLSFHIERDHELVAPARKMPTFKPVLIREGETYQKTVMLNSIFQIGDYGTYRVRGSVYLPSFQSFHSSNEKKINITSGTKVWHQGYGQRNFSTGGANLREYSLITHRTGSTSELYVRVRDQDQRRVLSTYSIGKLVNIDEPQVTLDGENNLHVLHMGAPKAYAHTVIDGDGNVLKQEVYRDSQRSKPILKVNQVGGVRVEGGMPDDPAKRAVMEKDAGSNVVRQASERPPGLPKF
ncbi:MAG: hypothetical protein AAGA58_17715 [Verrucomicrobiota bacterium]